MEQNGAEKNGIVGGAVRGNMSEKRDEELTPKTVVEIATEGNAVMKDAVTMLITRFGFWMDSRAGGNSMRTGYQAVPYGKLKVTIPVEGLKKGQEISCEDMSRILEANLSNLFPVVDVFVEESESEF